MKARLYANLNWLFADRILRLVGGLVIGVWIARYLGPEQFGLLSYALAFVALFAVVARLGLDEVVVRDLTAAPGKAPSILGTLLTLKLSVAALALLLVMPAAWFAQPGDGEFMALIAVIAVGMIFNVLDVYDLHYQAQTASRNVVAARGLSFLVFSAARVTFILTGCPLICFAAAATLEIALGGVLLAWLHWREFGRMNWHFDVVMMRKLLKDGWPLILSAALIVIHTRVDQVMLGQMLGTAEVGIYSAAVRLSESWLFVPLIIVQTVTPYLLKLRESNPAFYHVRLMQLYSLMFWIGAAVGLITLLWGEFFVMLLFGEAYRSAYWPLVIIIWTGIFISHAVSRGIWMVGENLQRYRLITNLFAVPSNILLNYWLIPAHGAAGAALASLLSIGGSTWLLPFLFAPMRASNRQMLLSIHPKNLFVGAR